VFIVYSVPLCQEFVIAARLGNTDLTVTQGP
jgi:hypothetical protein